MRRNVLSLFLLMLTLVLSTSTSALALDKHAEKTVLAATQSQNSQGRLYMIGILPNEVENAGTQTLDIYIASQYDCVVKITSSDGQVEATVNLKKNEVYSISSAKNQPQGWGWSYENRIANRGVDDKTIIIEASEPVSVYMLNSKPVSSEGMLAIPVELWGQEYYHCSFYDFKEGRDWRTGLMVIASEDKTKINIEIRDAINGGAFGKLHGTNRKVPSKITVNLDRGEIYMLQGDGLTRGVFDLSGTHITADKPIGLISGHERTMIPADVVQSGRDHIVAMMPPVEAWGKKYATVELDRKKDMGDYFRVVASEDNTILNIKWYDKTNGEQIGNTTEMLQAGDVREYFHNAAQWPENQDFPSVRGVSVFEADKPIFVMQYSFSAFWDRAGGNFDPFMFPVTAKEQFTTGTIFQTPSNTTGQNDFSYNLFSILAIGDTSDSKRHNDLIESIYLDGQQVSSMTNFRQIPGTDIYWAYLNVAQGPHNIYGDTPFGGYIYGFASFDSYGWPAATAYRNLSKTDTLAPEVEQMEECGEFTFIVTEDAFLDARNGTEGDDPYQEDTGISTKPKIKDGYNLIKGYTDADSVGFYDVKAKEMIEFRVGQGYMGNFDNQLLVFKAFVENKYEDAGGKITFIDNYGNETEVEFFYDADKLEAEPDPIDFGHVNVFEPNGNEIEVVTITADKESDLIVGKIEIKDGEYFSIEGLEYEDEKKALTDLPLAIKPHTSFKVFVKYNTKEEDAVEFVEMEDPLKLQTDQLVVTTFVSLEVAEECLVWEWDIQGLPVAPIIVATGLDFGVKQTVNKEYFSYDLPFEDYTIKNPGSDELVVSRITGIKGMFSMPNLTVTGEDADLNTPIVIPAGGEVNIYGPKGDQTEVTYLPTAPGVHDEFPIEFIANPYIVEKSTPQVTWKASTITSEILVYTPQFDLTRAGATNNDRVDPTRYTDPNRELGAYIVIENNGDLPGQVLDVNFDNTHFADVFNGTNIPYGKSTAIDGPWTDEQSSGVINIPAKSFVRLHVTFMPQDDNDFLSNAAGFDNGLASVTVSVDYKLGTNPESTVPGFQNMTGTAFKPQVTANNVTFDPTILGTKQTNVKVIKVENISLNDRKPLTIYNQSGGLVNNTDSYIEITEADITSGDYALVDADKPDGVNFDWSKVVAWDKINEQVLNQNEYFYLVVGYNPPVNAQDFNNKFNIVTDHGPYSPAQGGDPIVNMVGFDTVTDPETEVSGAGVQSSGVGLAVNDGLIPRALACDEDAVPITLTNLGDEVIIAKLVPMANEKHFTFDEADQDYIDIISAGGLRIAGNASVSFDVRYKALPKAEVEVHPNYPNIIADYKVTYTNEAGTSQDETDFQVSHVVEYLDIVADIQDGVSVDPDVKIISPTIPVGLDINFTAKTENATGAAAWTINDINLVNFKIRFKTVEFAFSDKIYEMSAGYTDKSTGPTITQDGDFTVAQFNLDLSGTPVQNDGVLLRLFGSTFVHPGENGTISNNVDIEIVDLEFPEYAECVTTEEFPGEIISTTCLQSVRSVVNSEAPADAIQQISPNPIESDEATINFTTTYASDVEFVLMDASGNQVGLLTQTGLSGGKHQLTLSTLGLATGKYFLTLKTERTSDTKDIIISK